MDALGLYGRDVLVPAATNSNPPVIYALYKALQKAFLDAHTAAGIDDFLAISPVTADAYAPGWGTDFRWVEYLAKNGTLDLVPPGQLITIPVNSYGFESCWDGKSWPVTPGQRPVNGPNGCYNNIIPPPPLPEPPPVYPNGRFEHYGVITDNDPPIVNKLKWLAKAARSDGNTSRRIMQIVNLGHGSFYPVTYKIKLSWKKSLAAPFVLVPWKNASNPAGVQGDLYVHYSNGASPAMPGTQVNKHVVKPSDPNYLPINIESAWIPAPDSGGPSIIDPDKFAAAFAADIYIDVAGDYWFRLELNGHATMSIGGVAVFNESHPLWAGPSENGNTAQCGPIHLASGVTQLRIYYKHVLSAQDMRQAAGDWVIKNYAHMWASRFQAKTDFRSCTVFMLDEFINGGGFWGIIGSQSTFGGATVVLTIFGR